MGFKQRNIEDMSVLGGFYASTIYFLLTLTLGWDPVTFIVYTIVTYASVAIIRSFYFKPRPKPQRYKNFIEKIDAASFPSLHCARAAIIALHAQPFVPLYTQAVIATGVVLVMYSRIMLKKHDIYDTLAGVVLAAIIFAV